MEKACRYCGVIFHVKLSHYDKKYYCSRSCMANDYSIRMTGNNNPNYRQAGIRICKQCGKEYLSYNRKRNYCSSGCYNASIDKKINSIHANDKRRKPSGHCKSCGVEIYYQRVYCEECNPNIAKPKYSYCKICGAETEINYLKYCKKCRSEGLHRKDVISICVSCGQKIPKYNRKYCDECWRRNCSMQRDAPRRVDANQHMIIDALEAAGCTVLDTSSVGHGMPDLIVGKNGINYLIEVKNPATRGKLNKLQEAFFHYWKGQALIVYTPEQALDAIGAIDIDYYGEGTA